MKPAVLAEIDVVESDVERFEQCELLSEMLFGLGESQEELVFGILAQDHFS